ncbi:class I SAM-dependent methyltransferase [Candidatus Micrarchaeota archaeon]|nr:class I SAM-dependent methyltransferase [Candidatus Micrarchaeota archaeon]
MQGPRGTVATVTPPRNRMNGMNSPLIDHNENIGKVAENLAEVSEAQVVLEREYGRLVNEILSEMGGNSLENLVMLLGYFDKAVQLPEEVRNRAILTLVDRISTVIEREDNPKRAITNLFETWAESYDDHMRTTGHEKAVDNLIKQLVELRRLGFGSDTKPILGDSIREESGGTGTVIKLLCDNMDPEEIAKIRITLNDLSPRMKGIARRKLEGLCDVEYTSYDLREAAVIEPVDTSILSQTLHLIADPELIKLEKDPDGVMENPEHEQIKAEVIERIFRDLAWNGYFVLIDEWPAKLSEQHTSPMAMIISRMFREIFRPIGNDRNPLRDKIIKRIPEARFVAELKARIDAKHSMYLLIYRKDPDKAERRGRKLPSTRGEIVEDDSVSVNAANRARAMAVRKIIEAFERVDESFRNGYVPVNGERQNWVNLIPFGEDIVINPSRKRLHQKKYGTIILAQKLHTMKEERRRKMINQALKHLKRGGSLLVIDEWDPPANASWPSRKRHFSDLLIGPHKPKTLIFEGALRQTIVDGFDSGMYGYLYRKVSC